LLPVHDFKPGRERATVQAIYLFSWPFKKTAARKKINIVNIWGCFYYSETGITDN
jgi:hypothetical protein